MAEPTDEQKRYERALLALLAALSLEIATDTEQLRLKQFTLEQWQSEILQVLMRYSIAALLLGTGQATLSAEAEQLVAAAVRTQAAYLSRFAAEIEAARMSDVAGSAWQDGWQARAELYADSIRPLYWRGATISLHIPVPGDGSSECKMADRCSLTIQWLDRQNGDADVWWNLAVGEGVEHCPTCTERNRNWTPLEVRGGEPQQKV